MKLVVKQITISTFLIGVIVLASYLNFVPIIHNPFEFFLLSFVLLLLLWRPLYVLGDIPFGEALNTHPVQAVGMMMGMFGFVLIAFVSFLVRNYSATN